MSPNLEACTPTDGTCAKLDTSEVAPVNGQTYDICGNDKLATGNICVGAEMILAAASTLQFNCSVGGLVGGSVDIGKGVTIRLW